VTLPHSHSCVALSLSSLSRIEHIKPHSITSSSPSPHHSIRKPPVEEQQQDRVIMARAQAQRSDARLSKR